MIQKKKLRIQPIHPKHVWFAHSIQFNPFYLFAADLLAELTADMPLLFICFCICLLGATAFGSLLFSRLQF